MGRRPWSTLSAIKSRKGYQKKRSRSHRHEFVRGGADSLIRMFDFGNRKRHDWEVTIGMMLDVDRKISHFTLEAMRRSINRKLQARVGRPYFYAKVRAHPHYVYREHKNLTVAGADRISSGMRNAFGKATGLCAVCHRGQILMEISVHMKNVEEAKKAMKIAGYKVGAKVRTVLLWTEKPEMLLQSKVQPYEDFLYTKN